MCRRKNVNSGAGMKSVSSSDFGRPGRAELHFDGDEPRNRGRPSVLFALSNRAAEQRKERLRRYSGLVSELQSPTKFISMTCLPRKAINVSLSLHVLLLLDLYVEYASERSSAVPNRFHHGSIIDTLAQGLMGDKEFMLWMNSWRHKGTTSEPKAISR